MRALLNQQAGHARKRTSTPVLSAAARW